MVPAGGYGKCSSFVCTDPEHQSAAAVSLLLKMKYVLNLLHMKAYLCIALPSVFMLFLYWLATAFWVTISCSFRAFSSTSVYYCAHTYVVSSPDTKFFARPLRPIFRQGRRARAKNWMSGEETNTHAALIKFVTSWRFGLVMWLPTPRLLMVFERCPAKLRSSSGKQIHQWSTWGISGHATTHDLF